jgi:hypothetical protein
MGYFGVKNCDFLVQNELRNLYQDMLVQENVQTDMKITVLKNILMFLAEEEQKMVRNDKDCKYFIVIFIQNAYLNRALFLSRESSIENGKSERNG